MGIAQAILGKPKLLILDEPTNGLDPKQTNLVRTLIRDLSKDATVILSTHIMQEVDALCSRALIIRNGKVAVDAELKELRKSNHLLLSSSLTKDEIITALLSIDNISSVDELLAEDNSVFSYRIELKDIIEDDAIIGQIARLIVSSGANLYSINKEVKDLEALFREANDLSSSTNRMDT